MFSLDYSFFNFTTSKDQLLEPNNIAELIYNGSIILNPNEKYLQIVSKKLQGLEVSIETFCGKKYDISTKVYIENFDNSNGLENSIIELAPLKIDFGNENVRLNFGDVYYSNWFLLTDRKDTFRLDYKSYKNYKGIDYENAQYTQSIRLQGYYAAVNTEVEGNTYTQLNGVIRKSRIIQKIKHTYVCEFLNIFTIERLLYALNSDICYINGIRSIITEDIKGSNFINQKTNIFKSEFTTFLDYSDTYTNLFQLFQPLTITNNTPKGEYIVNTVPYNFEIIFNRYIFGYAPIIIKRNGILYDNLIGIVIGYKITFNFIIELNDIATYSFELQNNNVFDFLGFTTGIIWEVNIKEPQYNNTQYNNTQYL